MIVEAGPVEESFAAVRASLQLAALVAHVPHQVVVPRVIRPADVAREPANLTGLIQLRLRVQIAPVVPVGLQKAGTDETLPATLAAVAARPVLRLCHRRITSLLALCNMIESSINAVIHPLSYSPLRYLGLPGPAVLSVHAFGYEMSLSRTLERFCLNEIRIVTLECCYGSV